MSSHSKWATTKHKKAIVDARRGKLFAKLIKNIEVAARQGGGDLVGTYEGYAPGGVAVLIECLTDNRNRAAAEVRIALTRNGGQLADPGSVSYVFTRKGVVIVPKEQSNGEATEDSILEVVLDAGAEEVNDNGESWEIVSEATDFVAVRQAIQDAGIDYDSAEASFVPNLQVPLDLDGARKMIRVIDALEDSDDVQNVYVSLGG